MVAGVEGLATSAAENGTGAVEGVGAKGVPAPVRFALALSWRSPRVPVKKPPTPLPGVPKFSLRPPDGVNGTGAENSVELALLPPGALRTLKTYCCEGVRPVTWK